MFSFLQVLKLLHVNDVEFNINNVGGRLDNSHRFSMMTLYIVLVEGRGPQTSARGPGRAAKFGPHATLEAVSSKSFTVHKRISVALWLCYDCVVILV